MIRAEEKTALGETGRGKRFYRDITIFDSLDNIRMWYRKTLQEGKQKQLETLGKIKSCTERGYNHNLTLKVNNIYGVII